MTEDGKPGPSEIHVLVKLVVALRHLQRRVRRVERQPYEERSRAIFRDESHRRFGEHIAAIALHFYGHPVVLENGVEITFPARRIRWLANAPAFEHQRFLKTL